PLGDDGGATPGTVRAAGQLERADVGVDDPGGTAGAEDTEHDVVLVDPFADVPQVVVVPGVLLLGDSRSDRLGGEVVQQPVERLAVDEPAVADVGQVLRGAGFGEREQGVADLDDHAVVVEVRFDHERRVRVGEQVPVRAAQVQVELRL